MSSRVAVVEVIVCKIINSQILFRTYAFSVTLEQAPPQWSSGRGVAIESRGLKLGFYRSFLPSRMT